MGTSVGDAFEICSIYSLFKDDRHPAWLADEEDIQAPYGSVVAVLSGAPQPVPRKFLRIGANKAIGEAPGISPAAVAPSTAVVPAAALGNS